MNQSLYSLCWIVLRLFFYSVWRFAGFCWRMLWFYLYLYHDFVTFIETSTKNCYSFTDKMHSFRFILSMNLLMRWWNWKKIQQQRRPNDLNGNSERINNRTIEWFLWINYVERERIFPNLTNQLKNLTIDKSRIFSMSDWKLVIFVPFEHDNIDNEQILNKWNIHTNWHIAKRTSASMRGKIQR